MWSRAFTFGNVGDSFLKEFAINFATLLLRGKEFLLTSKLCIKGVVCPFPGTVCRYKNLHTYFRAGCFSGKRFKVIGLLV